MLVAACSTILGDNPDGSSTSEDEPGSTSSGAQTCVRFTGDHATSINTGSLASDALHLSGEAFICADDVVVVANGDLNEVAAASQLAAAVSGPLLFPDPRLAAELGRLDAQRVHLVGSPEVNIPSGARAVTHDVASAVDLAQETLGVDEEVTVPATPDSSTIVETVMAIDDANRVVLPQSAPSESATSTTPDLAESEIVTGLAVASDAPSVWMVDAEEPETILLAAAVGRSLGATVIAFNGNDVLASPNVGIALEGRTAEAIRVVGKAPAASEWELAALANGQQVPGGGFYILPEDDPRRYVAFYGHPETIGLGVLGEQGPAETRARMDTYVEAYAADGARVIPTFEIIAAVAAAGPTDDGDYSFEWPAETFQPWLDFAVANDMYVVLDLQSGRDDFLTQAKMYEELLKLPYVGLALDPEWRLTSEQVHLNQIGSVSAAEVNEVIEWLAGLVRDNGLPQKLLIVHQFRHDMIRERETLKGVPELQLVIQMDGEGGPGGEAAKDATYDRLTPGTEDAPWRWGWKNFFDEDEPGPPPPENVLGKNPVPVFVSYQ